MAFPIPTPDYALLGGSFDPIHLGHLHIAGEILRLKAAKRVVFIPNGRHNFKQDSVILPFSQRLELISRAILPFPSFEVWDEDAIGSGYTDELLMKIFASRPEKTFAFVIGSDNLINLHNWHNFSWLQSHAAFLVIPRPGTTVTDLSFPEVNYIVLSTTPIDISSSQIRALIMQNAPIGHLVPSGLAEEITTLYKQRINRER